MRKLFIIVMFLMILFGFSIAHILLPDQTISKSERRTYQKFPDFKFDSSYMNELETYLLDHFPLREQFRSYKAKYNYYIMNMLDNNDIYLKDQAVFKMDYEVNEDSMKKFGQHVDSIKSLLTDNNQVYFMLIPDKNYYVDDKLFLKLDYERFKQLKFDQVKNIDIFQDLNLNAYYLGDSHWKQIELFQVVETMSKVMGFKNEKQDYEIKTFDRFYGVYSGESGRDLVDTIEYVMSDELQQVKVSYLEKKDLKTIYNEDNLDSLDAYEVFLDGASSLITIENDQCTRKKELVIFRDSFGSSLAPLLVPYYSKITIVDNRYITLDLMKDYVSFEDQDVLLMYNVTLVNDCGSLKN